MPLVNGEKFACSSCIKGHRVSGCNHTERELHHINPKGRPVKQCEHCRGARKSKSHHAKCDCGDKKDKDKHKDSGDAKVGENRCCCHSTGKCICGGKKDTDDSSLDPGKQTLHGARHKPKLNTAHSESTLTVFANGHHQPCHRKNNAAHVSGAPYKLSRPHTLHGHAEFSAAYSQGNSGGQADALIPRSMDTHSVSNREYHSMFGSNQSSINGLPMTPLTGSFDASGLPGPLFTGTSATFGQDSNSPLECPLSETMSASQWPWATSSNNNYPYGSLSTSPSQDCLTLGGDDWSIPSAGLDPVWSAGDLPLDPGKLTDTVTQPISHSGESRHSAPGLTPASSSHSEIEDTAWFHEVEMRTTQSAASENLFWEDRRPVTSMPNDGMMALTSVPTASTPDRQTFDLDFAKSLVNIPSAMTSTSSLDLHAAYATDFSSAGATAIPNAIPDVGPNESWLLGDNNPFNGFSPFDPSSYSQDWS